MIGIWTIATKGGAFIDAVVLSIAILLSGCPASQEATPPTRQTPPATVAAKPVVKPAKPEKKPEPPPVAKSKPEPLAAKPAEQTPQEALREDLQEIADKPRELGQPLVDDATGLVRLSGEQPIWIDKNNRHVVMVGEVCKAGYPLEFFATYSNRAYESVVSVNVRPSIIHMALLAVGAKKGHPARFQPEFTPPTGTEIAIEVRWKDAQGKVKSARAQDWVRDIKTKKALDLNWVFAGSIAETDKDGQITSYQADGGDMICVLSLPSALLDLPRHGYGAIESRSYEAFAERLPPEGTPVTLLLKPLLAKTAGKAEKKTTRQEPPQAEKKAVAAANSWLAFVDQGEYAKSWETAASYFKGVADRRDFVSKLNEVRKPLGKVKSRELVSKHYVTSLPGAPDGHYVVLQFKTVFEKKACAVETITPMLDKDKQWRVSGYYIK